MSTTQTRQGQPLPGASGRATRRSRLSRHWVVFLGAALAMTAGQFVYLSASILNPLLAEDLGVGIGEVVIYNSLMAIVGVPAMMFVGPALFRRIGVRATMIAGGLWLAASLAAVALVRDLVTLWLLGVSAGLTFGVVTFMAGTVLVNSWFEARRGTVTGAAFAVSGLGGIVAGLVLPALVADIGWRGGFLVLAGLLGTCVVLTGVFLVRSTPEKVALRPYGAPDGARARASAEIGLSGVPAREAFRSPKFAAVATAMLLVGGAQAFELHFAPVMMEHGVGLGIAGALLSLVALATVFSNVLLGMLNDHRGAAASVAVSLGCQALALAGTILANGPLALAVCTVLFAFGLALPAVLAPILVMRLFGMRDFTAILGPTTAMQPAGLAIGTVLWGLAVDRTDTYAIPLAVSGVLTVLAAVLIIGSLKMRNAHKTVRPADSGQLSRRSGSEPPARRFGRPQPRRPSGVPG